MSWYLVGWYYCIRFNVIVDEMVRICCVLGKVSSFSTCFSSWYSSFLETQRPYLKSLSAIVHRRFQAHAKHMIDNKWVDVKRHDSDAHAAGPVRGAKRSERGGFFAGFVVLSKRPDREKSLERVWS